MSKNTKNTTSIYMTAAFMALGAKLEDIDKTDPRHMIFSLSDGSIDPTSETTTYSINDKGQTSVSSAISVNNLEVWERAWANETLQVNAVRFMEAIQRLKSIIHSS